MLNAPMAKLRVPMRLNSGTCIVPSAGAFDTGAANLSIRALNETSQISHRASVALSSKRNSAASKLPSILISHMFWPDIILFPRAVPLI